MGLFTDPVVLDTRSFSFRAQINDQKNVTAGEWVEDAASIAAKSLLTVKHRKQGSVDSHLLQRTIYRVPAAATDGVLRKITVNLTVLADSLFTSTEVQDELDIVVDATGETGFLQNLLNGRI